VFLCSIVEWANIQLLFLFFSGIGSKMLKYGEMQQLKFFSVLALVMEALLRIQVIIQSKIIATTYVLQICFIIAE